MPKSFLYAILAVRYVAAQYDSAVHYRDEAGLWQDIDNTLQDGGNKNTVENVINFDDSEFETELQKMMNLEKLSSKVTYPNVFENTAIERVKQRTVLLQPTTSTAVK